MREGFRPNLVKRESGETQCWEMRTAKHQVLCRRRFFPPLEIQKFAGRVREWEHGGLDNTRPGKKGRRWVSGPCLLGPFSPKHALHLSEHVRFSSTHRERLHVLVSRPGENSEQRLKELAVLGSEPLACGGEALQLVCAAVPRLPAPPSTFQRRAFSFTKRGLCNSRRLWPTLVWLTWYGLLAGRKPQIYTLV